MVDADLRNLDCYIEPIRRVQENTPVEAQPRQDQAITPGTEGIVVGNVYLDDDLYSGL